MMQEATAVVVGEEEKGEKNSLPLFGIPNTASNSRELALGLSLSLNRLFSCK